MAKRKRTGNTMAKRKTTGNTMAKRKTTGNTARKVRIHAVGYIKHERIPNGQSKMDNSVLQVYLFLQEEFEDTKGVIRIRSFPFRRT
jgi:hypothetical protein